MSTSVESQEENASVLPSPKPRCQTPLFNVGTSTFIHSISCHQKKQRHNRILTVTHSSSTRGLDAANAVEFCKTLRLQSELFGQTCAVSMYQAPQSAYELFDKALVLYQGRQIYFGPGSQAKAYFERLGFACPPQQTTSDFLTSMTFPIERVPPPRVQPTAYGRRVRRRLTIESRAQGPPGRDRRLQAPAPYRRAPTPWRAASSRGHTRPKASASTRPSP